jgi:hypothetical protein
LRIQVQQDTAGGEHRRQGGFMLAMHALSGSRCLAGRDGQHVSGDSR